MTDEHDMKLELVFARCGSFLKHTESADGRMLATPIDRDTCESINSMISVIAGLYPDFAASLPGELSLSANWMTARIRVQEVVDCVYLIRKRSTP